MNDDDTYNSECDYYFYGADGDQHYIQADQSLEWYWDHVENTLEFRDFKTTTADPDLGYVSFSSGASTDHKQKWGRVQDASGIWELAYQKDFRQVIITDVKQNIKVYYNDQFSWGNEQQ